MSRPVRIVVDLPGPSGIRRRLQPHGGNDFELVSMHSTPSGRPGSPVQILDFPDKTPAAMLEIVKTQVSPEFIRAAEFNLADLVHQMLREVRDLPGRWQKDVFARAILGLIFDRPEVQKPIHNVLEIQSVVIDKRSSRGHTVLYEAMMTCHYATVIYLLKHGANPEVRSRDGGPSFRDLLSLTPSPKEDYQQFRQVCSWVDLIIFQWNHKTFDCEFYVMSSGHEKYSCGIDTLINAKIDWLDRGQIAHSRRIWVHVPSTNGSIILAIFQSMLKQDDSILPVRPDLIHHFEGGFVNPAVAPGNPSLNYRKPMYQSLNKPRQFGAATTPDRSYRAVVFPCLVVTGYNSYRETRGRYENILDLLVTKPSGTHSASRMLHLERTLDETYYPGLDPIESERRNQDQIISKVFKLTYPEAWKQKRYPILMVPQLWMWQMGKVIVSAYSQGLPPNQPLPWFESYANLDPLLQMGLMIADQIKRFGKEQKVNEHIISPPLALFETKVVTTLSTVYEYMRTSRPSQILYQKEKEILRDLFDVAAELTMVQDVLETQKDVLDKLLKDRPKSDTPGEYVIPHVSLPTGEITGPATMQPGPKGKQPAATSAPVAEESASTITTKLKQHNAINLSPTGRISSSKGNRSSYSSSEPGNDAEDQSNSIQSTGSSESNKSSLGRRARPLRRPSSEIEASDDLDPLPFYATMDGEDSVPGPLPAREAPAPVNDHVVTLYDDVNSWLRVEEATQRLEEYLLRVKKIQSDAERVEKAVQDQLDLKKTYASVKDAHNSLILSAAVIGFTVITIIFAPLAFLTALFALKVDSFHRLQRNASEDQYASGSLAWVFSVSELVTWTITGICVALAVWRIRRDDRSEDEQSSKDKKTVLEDAYSKEGYEGGKAHADVHGVPRPETARSAETV